MCGIAGILGPHDPALIARMCRLQAHRGPDGEGVLTDREAGLSLGHRRLSILDLELGKQPMATPDDALRVVFNGEIYNAPQLRRELESQGRRFVTRNSDTEVLLHLYAVHGPDMLERLMGMYAFCIHDRARGQLFLARDRTGVKPLYYTTAQGRFAFASELKALLELPWVSRDIDPASLGNYLEMQFVPAPRTIFAQVAKLPAGHCLSVDAKDLACRVRRYWRLEFDPDPIPDAAQWARRFRTALGNAVERWSLSDVPIACSLSGGLDSSSIVGLLAMRSATPIRTYSLGFRLPEAAGIDELDLAREVSRKWGTQHHEILLAPQELLDDLDDMVWHLDEPYGGGLPTWYVFRHMARDVKVAMTGTGGDELFGNYGKWTRLEAPLEEGLRLAAEQTGESGPDRLRLIRTGTPHGALYHRYMTLDRLKDILADGMRPPEAEAPEYLLERLWNEAGSPCARDNVAAIDFQLQLPEEFLLMTDRFSMAHGLEARVPFLDEETVDVARRIPASLRTRPDGLKYLLKMAVKDLLPPALLDAPKRGFVLPLEDWTRHRLRPRILDVLAPARLKRQGIFNKAGLDRLVAPHMRGEADYTQQVWTIFMFQLWYERFAG